MEVFAWGTPFSGKSEPKPAPRERRDPLILARHDQSLLDSGKLQSRAALARYLGVSRTWVTQVTNSKQPIETALVATKAAGLTQAGDAGFRVALKSIGI